MILAGFGLIGFGLGLIWVGFGLIWLGFWSIRALIARVALQEVLGGSQELPGSRGKSVFPSKIIVKS